MSRDAITAAPWAPLRRYTAARIALGSAGGSLPTREVLAFAADHAAARDAVHASFAAAALAGELHPLGAEILLLASAAPDRTAFLQRPDWGRKLSPESSARLAALGGQTGPDLVVLVSDGLSALAAHRQTPPLLAALWPQLRGAGFSLGPLCLVRHARVALQDEAGALLGARQSLMLLGERPGLGTPDSLGAYLTYAPRPGRTDAERNCVSNIRPGGLPPAEAAARLVALLLANRRQKLSGTALKEDIAPVAIS